MVGIETATAGAISRATEYGLSITILVLAVIGLGYLHHVCRKENAENRKENREMGEKFTAALLESAKSIGEMSSSVRELKEVIRSK